MDNRHLINSRQLMLFVMTAQIGIGIVVLPSLLAKEAGHDGWISAALAGVLSAAVIIFIGTLLNRYGDKSILEINKILYGKILGTLFNLILVSYLFYAVVVGGRIFGEIIKLSVLKNTPSLVLGSFIIIPTVYLVWYGLKPIVRFALLLPVILFLILLFLLLLAPEMRLTFLLPVGATGIEGIAKGILPSVFAFLGFELVAFIYPYVKEKKEAMKFTLLATLFSLLFFLILIASATMLFGENMLKLLNVPLFSMARAYHAPIIERLDLFLIILWFPAMAASLRTYFFTGFNTMIRLFGIRNETLFLGLYTVIALLLGTIPANLVEVYKHMDILSFWGVGVMGFLIFSCLVSFINKRGVVPK